jgi:hypothetical protein
MASGEQDENTFKIHSQYFQGGSTVDFKMGIANSFYSSQNLDFRTFPSQMSVLPASRSIAINLADTITAMQQDLNGVRWGIGDAGNLYEINTSNAVSRKLVLPEAGSAGLLYSQITDQLYIPGQTAVSMYGQVTTGNENQPQYRPNQFGKSASIAAGCTALFDTIDSLFNGLPRNDAQIVGQVSGITEPSQVGNPYAFGAYVLPNSILEDPTDFCFFAPDIEPFYSIAVYATVIGTGDWTLTLHDSLNTPLAIVTIAHADITLGWNEFVFSKQVRALVNASNTGFAPTYHFHLTIGDIPDTAAVATITAADLSTANFLLFAYRLVQTNNGWHPTAYFTGTGTPLLCMGNGEYLSTYNFANDANPSNSLWQRHNLTFRPGDEVCGLTVNNQYLVIATERRSNDSSRNSQIGSLWFWDGSTTNANFNIDIPWGSPYGLYTVNNITYFACAGSLFAWSGGSTVLKVRRLAYQNTDYMDAVDQTRVNPNGFTSRYNILMMGYPSFTTDPNIDYGIWSWGAVELTYPNSYGYSYSQSIAPNFMNYSGSNNLQLGCVQNFVDSMYSSWSYTDAQEVTHYGLDVIDNFSDPATFFNWLSLIFDGGVVYKEKMAVRYKIYFEALPTGSTLTPIWYIDRGSVQTGPTVSAGATEVFVEMNNARFHELQYGLQGTCAGTTPPVILGITMEISPLEDEVDLLPGEV